MADLIVHPSGPLAGQVAVPGDKSITHRALILGALADGPIWVRGWVPAAVCYATLHCLQALGVHVEEIHPEGLAPVSADAGPHGASRPAPGGTPALLIHGVGLDGLREPPDVLHCAGSGTTMRLLAGLLAGQPFTSVLTGTEALRRRPMGRIAEPLRQMGATVLGREGGRLAPLTIRGGNLRGIEYRMAVASAQVKSAILLAGLFAEGETVVHEPAPSRDHTERMLRAFGVRVEGRGLEIRLRGRQPLRAACLPQVAPPGGFPASPMLNVPGDFSSAAFPLVAGAIVPGSRLRLLGVGVNPTRTGLYDLLEAMGSQIRSIPPDNQAGVPADVGEPAADLEVAASELRGTEVGGPLVVRAIDEFPVFAVAATQARGTTTIRDAAELRVKESDRISTVAEELSKMGAHIEELPDGMIVRGPTRLRGAVVDSRGDHRLAMALAVAGLRADGETVVRNADVIADSFPDFVETMQALGADIAWRGERSRSREAGED